MRRAERTLVSRRLSIQVYVSTDGGASWAGCPVLQPPAWSHAPPLALAPRSHKGGRPKAPTVTTIRRGLEACLLGVQRDVEKEEL